VTEFSLLADTRGQIRLFILFGILICTTFASPIFIIPFDGSSPVAKDSSSFSGAKAVNHEDRRLKQNVPESPVLSSDLDEVVMDERIERLAASVGLLGSKRQVQARDQDRVCADICE